jgi:hypothetical protein
MADIGFTTAPLPERPDLQAQGAAAFPSTPGESFDPLALTKQLLRVGTDITTEQGAYDEFGNEIAPPEPSVPAEELQQRYGGNGLTFDKPLPDSVAKSMYDAKWDELKRQDIAQRAPGGFWDTAERVGIGLVSQALDPVNLAASFIPVVGEARYAQWLAEAGGPLARAAIRVGVGAASGAAGQAALEPLRLGLASQEQSDYGINDAAMNIVYGGILGGGLHAAAGVFSDAIRGAPGHPEATEIMNAPLPVQEAAMRTAIAQTADDRPVDVAPVFDARAIQLMSRATELQERDKALAGIQASTEVHPKAAEASGTLARLQAIEDQRNNTTDPNELRDLNRRRDELLGTTTPEELRAQVAGADTVQRAGAMRANIAQQLQEIQMERDAFEARNALAPGPKVSGIDTKYPAQFYLPKEAEEGVQAVPYFYDEQYKNAAEKVVGPRYSQAVRYATRQEETPDIATTHNDIDTSLKTQPTDVTADLKEYEDFVRQAQALGEMPENIPELQAADEDIRRATALQRAYKQAGVCLAQSAGEAV